MGYNGVQGKGFRVEAHCIAIKVQGSGFRVQRLGLRHGFRV